MNEGMVGTVERDNKGKFQRGHKEGFQKGYIPWNKNLIDFTNGGSFKEGNIPWNKGTADLEKREERCRQWHKANSERTKECHRLWREANPERTKEMSRNAGKKHAFGSLERYEEAFYKYDGFCAFACGKEAKLVHHMDGKSIHNKYEPNNNLSNLLPLCRACHMQLHKSK